MKRRIDRNEILKAGRNLMFLNGYEATGIKSITDEVGIPKGSFYNHFENKELFGLEVVENYCMNGIEYHKHNLTDKNKSPLERLKFHYNDMIDDLISNSNYKLGCIMGNFSLELADVNEKFRVLLDRNFEIIQDIIKECIIEGQELKEINSSLEADTMASFILNSWHGAILRMKSTADSKPLGNFKDIIFKMLAA